MTCNIYDTDMLGECREYNTISTPEQHVPEPSSKPQDKVTETTKALDSTSTTVATISSTHKDVPIVEDHPLELEVVLSSTVVGNDKKGGADKGDIIISA